MAKREGGVLVIEGADTRLTSGEVAQYLGISPYKARNLMHAGEFGEVTTEGDDGKQTHPRVRFGGVREYVRKRGGVDALAATAGA